MENIFVSDYCILLKTHFMAGAPVKMRPHVKKIEVIILAVSFSTMLPYHCHAQIAVCDRFAHFSFSTRIRVSLPL